MTCTRRWDSDVGIYFLPSGASLVMNYVTRITRPITQTNLISRFAVLRVLSWLLLSAPLYQLLRFHLSYIWRIQLLVHGITEADHLVLGVLTHMPASPPLLSMGSCFLINAISNFSLIVLPLAFSPRGVGVAFAKALVAWGH